MVLSIIGKSIRKSVSMATTALVIIFMRVIAVIAVFTILVTMITAFTFISFAKVIDIGFGNDCDYLDHYHCYYFRYYIFKKKLNDRNISEFGNYYDCHYNYHPPPSLTPSLTAVTISTTIDVDINEIGN